jgi:hypothetical protein
MAANLLATANLEIETLKRKILTLEHQLAAKDVSLQADRKQITSMRQQIVELQKGKQQQQPPQQLPAEAVKPLDTAMPSPSAAAAAAVVQPAAGGIRPKKVADRNFGRPQLRQLHPTAQKQPGQGMQGGIPALHQTIPESPEATWRQQSYNPSGSVLSVDDTPANETTAHNFFAECRRIADASPSRRIAQQPSVDASLGQTVQAKIAKPL